MYQLSDKLISIIFVLCIVYIPQINAQPFSQDFTGKKIIVGGTGDSQSLLRSVARALEKELKGGKVEVPDTVGSTGGIKALVADRVDLARVARPLTVKERQRKLTYLVFAQIPVVFVVHPSVGKIDNLKYQDIAEIYSGHINNWNQVGDVDHKIYPLTREHGDSALKIITKYHPDFKAKGSVTKTIYSTPMAVESLQEHEHTIGYLPLANVKGTQLRILKLDGVYPSAINIQQGRYKLAMPLALVYKNEPEGLVKVFIDFIFSKQGQKIISDFGAIPVDRLLP